MYELPFDAMRIDIYLIVDTASGTAGILMGSTFLREMDAN
jgi:hypothetical protein